MKKYRGYRTGIGSPALLKDGGGFRCGWWADRTAFPSGRLDIRVWDGTHVMSQLHVVR